MRRVSRANLLVAVGLELEVVWLPLLIKGARNPVIVPGSHGYMDASRGIRVLEVPSGKIDRSQGDIHPEGNPHYWLDPRSGLLIAARIAERLSSLSPGDADLFQANLVVFRNRLEQQRVARCSRGNEIPFRRLHFELEIAAKLLPRDLQ